MKWPLYLGEIAKRFSYVWGGGDLEFSYCLKKLCNNKSHVALSENYFKTAFRLIDLFYSAFWIPYEVNFCKIVLRFFEHI